MKSDNRLDSKPIVIIYCNEWCNYLSKLVNLLQKKQMSFAFENLEYDTEIAQKLLTTFGRPLMLPVINIDGTYYIKPAFSELNEVLDMISWRESVDRNQFGKALR